MLREREKNAESEDGVFLLMSMCRERERKIIIKFWFFEPRVFFL